MIARNKCLRYHHPNQDVTLEQDSIMKGIGVVLIQNDLLIAFGRKSLTSAQANYNNIERECLAFVYRIHKFYHCLYGRKFTVISDLCSGSIIERFVFLWDK